MKFRETFDFRTDGTFLYRAEQWMFWPPDDNWDPMAGYEGEGVYTVNGAKVIARAVKRQVGPHQVFPPEWRGTNTFVLRIDGEDLIITSDGDGLNTGERLMRRRE